MSPPTPPHPECADCQIARLEECERCKIEQEERRPEECADCRADMMDRRAKERAMLTRGAADNARVYLLLVLIATAGEIALLPLPQWQLLAAYAISWGIAYPLGNHELNARLRGEEPMDEVMKALAVMVGLQVILFIISGLGIAAAMHHFNN